MNETVALVFKWADASPRRAFQLEYGHGICETVWLILFDDCKEAWSGTLPEFLKWVKA